MNVSTYLSGVSQVSPSSYPTLLWDFYIQYLWNYQSNSLVDRVASTCRVLAILVSLPIIILGLLDISSYGIARTLGVIDDVKASTSDSVTNTRVPSIRIVPSTSSLPYPDSENETSQPRAFFASDEGSNFRLSGADLFSPAATRPSSPVLCRKSVEGGKTLGREEQEQEQDHDIRLRLRVGRDAEL